MGSIKKEKYIPIRYTVTLLILTIFIPLLIILEVVNYFSQQTDLTHNYKLLQQQTENNIKSEILLVNSAMNMLELSLRDRVKRFFSEFINEYNKNGGKPFQIDLYKLQQQFGSDVDLYIISADGIVIATTYQKDLNLNFNKLGFYNVVLTPLRT